MKECKGKEKEKGGGESRRPPLTGVAPGRGLCAQRMERAEGAVAHPLDGDALTRKGNARTGEWIGGGATAFFLHEPFSVAGRE